MKLISLNVSLPRELCWEGRSVRTGIFKEPVFGPLAAERNGIEGDGQADREHHGGENKAVYAYPSEHYPFWRGEMPGVELPWGTFGENLSTEGLLEEEIRVGDRFRVGEVLLRAVQPREPCAKLALRLGDKSIPKRFLQSLRSGIYFAVDEPGHLCAGDPIELVDRVEPAITIRELARVIAGDGDPALLRHCLTCPDLVPKLREICERGLAEA
jgi:MOSC domain-containing protein YiiM